MNEDDTTTNTIQQAADAMREACHAAYDASHLPGDVYRRLGALT